MAHVADQTTTPTSPVHGTRIIRSGPVETARTVLRADAVLCAASGIALVAAAPPLASLVDGSPVGAVRAVGALLVVIAADFALLSRVRDGRVATAATVAAALNVAWVVGTLAVVGLLERGGIVVALAGAVVAAGFAWEEFVVASAARRNQVLVERIGA